ncbi:type II secretion system F family protein [Rhodovulum bhavnagarense]|uniref:type II secretion system F family protein n=1 Tax=Rhodovulum bhavnagarense TaxID=992286 RepID=UPI001404652F|nr:type II secretion system F family protein [Rhodovulum bhavnagarense]
MREVERVWSDALDLMLLSVRAGMGIDAALSKVAREVDAMSPALAYHLRLTAAELSHTYQRSSVLDGLASRLPLDSIRYFVQALNYAERHGTPLTETLVSLAAEGRDNRLARAEKKAAGLAPRLTLPMIVFFLPQLFLILMFPAISEFLTPK